MIILNSELNDITAIFKLYQLATDFQKIKFPGNLWPVFGKELIIQEINENRQFKIVIDHKIACIWAITYQDAQIWEDSENESALYIHRIATNPEFRGRNFVQSIVDWSKNFAQKQNINFIRLDTCGRNDQLINHYKKCGFNFLGMKKLKNTSELPSHYHDAEVCYFEIELA
ncbi:MAG: GNAT family N-acetyltransferase [Bacteroidetes bacterium]|nr:GNAT family N-acetyltransferase [Bacteroidota bacterium]MBU1371596.1 GNAT family N-acetyltransferase [Bacteroidota bacterium]MBU1484115.1 GNAT family N-acetyltransferase [Bacteroidota bacterium]MBU1759852.1 GNAT family N-acetyltransferase [Bacteroidota bacterium]MBU2045515.1 GNAT family N-acetyltransferase [Bacteroidota bacterium]